MTDTETRLRDYLQARAAIVPDTAQGPGLEEPGSSSHRRWPVILAAAAIAAVLVLTVSFLTRLNGNQIAPSGPPVPPPTGAPRVPYLTQSRTTTTVHDGSQQVAVKQHINFVNGRVAGGWLTSISAPAPQPAGILKPDGKFIQVGPDKGNFPTLSPDRSQIAVSTAYVGEKGRIVVIDVRTGKQVASTKDLGATPALLGWNQDGIWTSLGGMKSDEVLLWKPGQDRPRTVAIPGTTGGAVVQADTRTTLVTSASGNTQCIKAGFVDGGKFKVLRERCQQGPGHPYPVLSPDGRVMVNSLKKEAIDIVSGAITRLNVPDEMLDWPEPVFEDATNLLVVSRRDVGHGQLAQSLYRCNITGGACVLIMKNADDLTLQKP